MPASVLALLEARIAQGEAHPDPAQRQAAMRLDKLSQELRHWRRSRRLSLGRLFGVSGPPAPSGLYIWGQVGRGKTMLMDLFHEASSFEPRRRIHFHAFMAEVHERINAARERLPGDPIPQVAREIASKAQLLCFDEFHVTDIADAMILGRLFTALFERQVIIVATSNVPPDGLYKNGLNRQLFLPFIDLLKQKTEVMELVADRDFRQEKLTGVTLYFSPLDSTAAAGVRSAFARISGVVKGKPAEIEVKGRKIRVPEAANGVAIFDFADLCIQPLGPLDYLAIAQLYHTVVITNVPALNRNRRAEARRFINLIDTLYDAHVGLIVSAATEPDDIYPLGDEAFLFERTASRLIEMRSESYLNSRDERRKSGTAPPTPPTAPSSVQAAS